MSNHNHAGSPIDLLVVGAGISGLTVAHDLASNSVAEANGSNQLRIIVTEAQNRVGGAIVSQRDEVGFQWEEGPNSFQPAPELLKLAAAVGLKDELVFADGKLPRFVFWNGKLNALPMSPQLLTKFNLLTIKGKLRAFLGAIGFVRPAAAGEETVAQFFKRHLGQEVVDRLVVPFISGVYAGNTDKLSAAAAFGKIFRLEKNYNGLVAGAILSRLAKRKQEKAQTNQPANIYDRQEIPKTKPGQLGSFKNGIEALPRAIAEDLIDKGHEVRLQWRLDKIQPNSDGTYSATYETPHGIETITARALLLTTPAYVSSMLLQDIAPDAAQSLGEIYYPPVACVVLGYPDAAMKRDMNGFGNLIPRSQGIRTLGTIWGSSLFSDRAPAGYHLLLNFIGGSLDTGIADLSEPEIAQAVHSDLKQTLLKPDTTIEPKVLAVHLWQRAIPQYEVGHLDRLARVERDLANHPGLFVSANFIGGVALGDCVKRSFGTAEQIKGFLNLSTKKK
ncbi:protoporphyrinogen oxidase [Thalassoporum mexicanum PCC 7367]|uniref:protoporphyrinogen oxidase n=1 Tax=Thalassoporum mexicanum TaxID=3457544 RepID=UPI00029FB153|nr:protoporphyrinogen oxidase [Pseudanabaena sp. PCC 7367]AFY70550.1 protoporphyrinogen oxidase [Pseudanabaena sp. PCC 7367]